MTVGRSEISAYGSLKGSRCLYVLINRVLHVCSSKTRGRDDGGEEPRKGDVSAVFTLTLESTEDVECV